MAEDIKLQESVKKTQDLLGKYIKKPPLTDKLLKKPPFRFIHDIISAIIKETGFLKNLFTEDELNSANYTDKDTKLAYLTKLIDAVKLITGHELSVRPSKIISGQEPIKTNELFHAIGRALDKKVSSDEAIEYYKKNQAKKKDSNAKKSTSKPSSQSPSDEKLKKTVKKTASVEKLSSGSKEKSKDNKDRGKDRESKEKSSKEKVREKDNKDRKEKSSTKEREKREVRASSRDRDDGTKTKSSSKDKEKRESKTSSSEKREKSKKESNDGSKIKRSGTFEKKLSETRENEETNADNQSKPETEILVKNDDSSVNNLIEKEEKIMIRDISPPEEMKKDLSIVDNAENIANNLPTAGNEEKLVETVDKTREKTENDGEIVKKSEQVIDKIMERPPTRAKSSLLRPPSARPPSARPAAPRVRNKQDFIMNNNMMTQMADINVIVENFDMKEEDAEDMVVVETATIEDALLTTNSTDLLANSQIGQEHGHLVAQILETQRDLVHKGNVEIIPNKVEIEWDSGLKKDRDLVVKEIDKLRGTIQMLTRATNPLGKLFDFLQEDVELMQRELRDWRNQFTGIRDQLIIERNNTKELLKPLEDSLREVEANINGQIEKIHQTKCNILKNNQKISRLLSGQ